MEARMLEDSSEASKRVASELLSALLLDLRSVAPLLSDPAGNLKLAKDSQGGRRQRHKDDLAAAVVLAVGTGLRHWKPGMAEAPADDDVVFIAR